MPRTKRTQACHTPGPWRVEPFEDADGGCRAIVGASGDNILHTVGLDSDAEDAANAALICASPDLLAALEMVMYQYNEVHLQLPAADVAIIRAAIAKARNGAGR